MAPELELDSSNTNPDHSPAIISSRQQWLPPCPDTIPGIQYLGHFIDKAAEALKGQPTSQGSPGQSALDWLEPRLTSLSQSLALRRKKSKQKMSLGRVCPQLRAETRQILLLGAICTHQSLKKWRSRPGVALWCGGRAQVLPRASKLISLRRIN
jgi:hypothetical protein